MFKNIYRPQQGEKENICKNELRCDADSDIAPAGIESGP